MDAENILEGLKKNKGKIFTYVLCLVAFIILVTSINNIIKNYNDKRSLEKSLVALGERIYTDVYYSNLKKDPKEYENGGIKITLEDMFEIINLESKDYFYNRKTKEACDINESYVKIFPKSPYGINDYELEFVLNCGY